MVAGLPPTTNHIYKVKRGGIYKVDEAKRWQRAAVLQIRAQRAQPAQDWRDRTIQITLTWYMRRPLSSDWDNRIKPCQDAVAEALGFNDRYVWVGNVRKRRIRTGAEQTVIYIEDMGAEPVD